MSVEMLQAPTIDRAGKFKSNTESLKVSEEPLLAYDPQFDIDNYSSLRRYSGEEYRNKKRQMDLYTERQLVTNLGERYHVMLSTNFYDFKEGKLYGENTDEPFENMLVRGRNYRREHGNKIDHPREDAEVIGFLKVQDFMSDEKTPLGSMMVSISPPGGVGTSYNHNFYDVFTLKEDKFGRYVEARRYSSALTREEYALKASELDTRFTRKYVPTDAEFLANPIKIDPDLFRKPEDIHRFFHIGHKNITDEEFDYIVKSCASFSEEYIDELNKWPIDENRVILIFNAMLNKADEAVEEYRVGNRDVVLYVNKNIIRKDILRLGVKEVREELVGCGKSGGVSTRAKSAFSVSVFANMNDEYGSLAFECPKCKKQNIRQEGELMSSCQHCGGDVTCE